jgi:1-deoxy-D-xylulose-5-phosphate synthase
MLDWSVEQNELSVAIRVPTCELNLTGNADYTDYSKEMNKFKMVKSGEKIAVIGLGNFFGLAENVVDEIKAKLGIDATLINPRFITGIDKEMLDGLKSNHDVVVTLEDGELNGGFGEKVASYLGNSDIKVLNYGSHKEFTDRVPLEELYRRYRLTPEQITEDASKCLKVSIEA